MARRRMWIDTVMNHTIAAGSTALTVVLTRGISDNDLKGMTLVRVLLQLTYFPANLLDDTGVQRLAAGIGVSGQEAIQASSVSILSPQEEDEFPSSGWLYRNIVPVLADATPGFPVPIIDKDIRAQRKLMYGAPWIRFVNLNQQGTAFSVRVDGVIRCLYLLP